MPIACSDEAMSNLQIKNVPETVHTELRRRAEQAGLSLRDYMLRLIRRDLALPSVQDWLAEIDQLEPVPEGGATCLLLVFALVGLRLSAAKLK